MKGKRHYIILAITVISLGLLLIGGTYAWLTFGPAIIGGNQLSANTTCFIMDYDGTFSNPSVGDIEEDGDVDVNDAIRLIMYDAYKDGEFDDDPDADYYDLPERILKWSDFDKDGDVDENDAVYLEMHSYFPVDYPLGGNTILFPSKTDKGGLSGTVTMNISEECAVSANGNIKMTIGSGTSNKYFMNGVLKYSLYASDNTTLLGSGVISSTGAKTLNTNPITLTKTPTTYYVYVWLDGTKVDNSYLNLPFSGYLHASATQTES